MQVKITKTFFRDITEGKVYTAKKDKEGLWIENDWNRDIWLNLTNEYNKELIEYEIVK
ncbi:hypothetical protein INMBNBLA_00014 [Klebsiella phage vB_KoM-Liquor]|nr:hypothetical protein [Klebsiella phage vB_KpnM_VAC13]WKC55501.1 hypothetical protein R41_53 [Klebsiella phage R4_1]CAD5241015.1 hypothetical protein EKPIEFBL_00030 [Klebsiella phage vB_KpM-Milk]CAD5241108.1 hypothetical protein INMBNBLA_00014 [Klebsiella phage vB_KoM-Liquor]